MFLLWCGQWWVEWLKSEVRLRLLKRGRYIINTGTRTFLRLTLTSLAHLSWRLSKYCIDKKLFLAKPAASRFSLATNKKSYFRERERRALAMSMSVLLNKVWDGCPVSKKWKKPRNIINTFSHWRPSHITKLLVQIHLRLSRNQVVCEDASHICCLFVAIPMSWACLASARQQRTDASQHEQRTILRSSTNAV